jgi:hypothetical protein
MMLAIEAGAERYYSHFAELERELELAFPGIADQFFVKNGARFLNLLRGGSTRWRIEQTFARQGTRPAWLDAPLLQLE